MRIKGIGAILASSVIGVSHAVAMADETKGWRCRNDGALYETILGQNKVNPGRIEQLTAIFNIELTVCEKLSLKVQKFFSLTDRAKPECQNPNQPVFNMYLPPEGQVNPGFLRLPAIIWPDEQVLQLDNRAGKLVGIHATFINKNPVGEGVRSSGTFFLRRDYQRWKFARVWGPYFW